MESILKIKFAVLFLIILLQSSAFSKEYKLYFLGGQSNMTGYGYVSDLPEAYKKQIENVLIFEGSSTLDFQKDEGLGVWSNLQPGHGEGFKSDGDNNYYSDRFGLELSFGKMIQNLSENKNIAIIKYARSGSSIDASAAGDFGCWEPNFNDSNGINQYDHFLATIKNALSYKDIDGDGEEDILVPTGIVWMQGESDATNTYKVAKNYSYNLRRLVELFRAALRKDDLPVVIGRISDSRSDENEKVWKYGHIIREEQEFYAETESYASLITTTDGYEYSDKWHYDSKAYIDLGIQFADSLYKLEKSQDSCVK